MASLNIPSTCTDPSYRYKMPAIVTKVEGKGKMIKTLILNMDAVAKALGRPASYIVRFFGTELGSPSKDDMIISGTHSAATLQSLLDKFIEKYVLCRKCCNPEVELSVQKGIVSGHCVACGWCGPMENNDKLAEFILKQDNKDKGNGKKMDKRERQLAKANAAKETAQKLLASAEVNEDNDAATNAGAEMRPEIKKKGEKKEKKEHKEGKEHKKDKKDKKDKEHKKEKKEHKEGKENKESKENGGGNAKAVVPQDLDHRKLFKDQQKFMTPPVADATRAFYESLLKEKPESTIAVKFCVEYGVLPLEDHTKLVKTYNKLRDKGKFSQNTALKKMIEKSASKEMKDKKDKKDKKEKKEKKEKKAEEQ